VVIQGLLGGVGAGLALPLSAESHPLEHHAADPALMARAAANAAAPKTTPEFLDPHAYETLASMAERIVPGATKAGVAPFVDTLLAVDTPENQRRFLTAVGALEGDCIARFGRPWTGLTEEQQTDVLKAASTGSPGREDKTWRPGDEFTLTEKPPEPRVPTTLRDHFDHLKQWVSGAYYSSEIGMRELGWTGQQFFASFPGCPHPGGHR